MVQHSRYLRVSACRRHAGKARRRWRCRPGAAADLARQGRDGSPVRMRIENILEWAIAAEHYALDNPAKRDRVKHLLGAQTDVVEQHEALPYEQIGDFMTRAPAIRWHRHTAPRTLRFDGDANGRALTGRMEESIGRRRSGLSLASTAKRKRGRSDGALVGSLHRDLPAGRATAGNTGLIFRRNRHTRHAVAPHYRWLSENTLLDTLAQLGQSVTVHGFRSSFRDWAGDCTAYPREVIEAALCHEVGDEVELAYRRRTALE